MSSLSAIIGSFRFEFPWALLLLFLIPLVIWRAAGERSSAFRFSEVTLAGKAGRTWRVRFRNLPLALRTIALVFVVLALARPQQGRESAKETGNGIAIEMALDFSSSMGEEFESQGGRTTRFEAAKRIFRAFIFGDGKDLLGRPGDLAGLVAFAGNAYTVCPLTLSHEVMERFLDEVKLPSSAEEDGTALGDGLALAAARLGLGGGQPRMVRESTNTDAGNKSREHFEVKSKVVILLTDGNNNCGMRSPEQAARLAKMWGVKVYAIGVGPSSSWQAVKTPFGSFNSAGRAEVDKEALKGIAAETGGAFYLAESDEKLQEVYAEIDKLEKTEIEGTRFTVNAEKFFAFALAALGVLLLEQLLSCTVFRRVP
jgi:Ca-activated chloride channel homolog